jgi:hypothetical protein
VVALWNGCGAAQRHLGSSAGEKRGFLPLPNRQPPTRADFGHLKVEHQPAARPKGAAERRRRDEGKLYEQE